MRWTVYRCDCKSEGNGVRRGEEDVSMHVSWIAANRGD